MSITFSKAIGVGDGKNYCRYTLFVKDNIVGRYYLNVDGGYIEWAIGATLTLKKINRPYLRHVANLSTSTGKVVVDYKSSDWAIGIDYKKSLEIDGQVWSFSKLRPDGYRFFSRKTEGAYKFLLVSEGCKIVYQFKLADIGPGASHPSFTSFRGTIDTDVEDLLPILAGCYLIDNCLQTESH